LGERHCGGLFGEGGVLGAGNAGRYIEWIRLLGFLHFLSSKRVVYWRRGYGGGGWGFFVIFLRIRNSKGVVSWMGARRELGLLALYEGDGKFDFLFSSFNISQYYLVIIYKSLKVI
jgi:hypothetical protein